ncbi:MAG: P-loop NTPase fold protein [Campylobacterota bacterium]|nr:P-loop NTPase fold protein [Campylobacterota bacterium]
MQFQNDEYTLMIKDLGHEKQIKNIRELVLQASTPFSIGLSGRWGSGKTSVMKHLLASLNGKPTQHILNFDTVASEEKEKFDEVAKSYPVDAQKFKHIHTIWFNPWEHENHEEPMVGLLQEIHNHFTTYAKSKNEIRKIASITIQSGLDMLGAYLKVGKNQGTNIVNIGEKYEKDNFQSIERNQKFKMAFQEAIKLLLLKEDISEEKKFKEARVVIFIDDLDRCEDATIAKLLKEIKQYLSTKYCVFVFGYDRQHIEKSLSKTEVKSSKDARIYLEKLFQATFYIKEPTVRQIHAYVNSQLSEREDSWYRTDFIPFVISIIDPNPRRIKNYLTTLYFHINMVKKTEDTLAEYKKMALIAYLKLFYEPVYSALENKPDMLDAIVKVCSEKDMMTVDNKEQYFVYLEFLSHFDKTNESELLDPTSREKIVDYSDASQKKFLDEVYQMQGRHSNFKKFKEVFYANFKEEENIERYL